MIVAFYNALGKVELQGPESTAVILLNNEVNNAVFNIAKYFSVYYNEQ